MTIEIYSPETFKIPGGKIFDDYKRRLTLDSAEAKDGHYLFTFPTSEECSRMVDFIRFVQKTNKIDGFYTIHIEDRDDWISGRMMDQTDELTIVVYHYRQGMRIVRRNIKEI